MMMTMIFNTLSSLQLIRLFINVIRLYRVVQKTDTQFYFGDNFGNSSPILTIFSLLQVEIYGA